MRNRNRNNRRPRRPRIAVWLVDGLPRLMAADARVAGSPLAVAADTPQNREMFARFIDGLTKLAGDSRWLQARDIDVARAASTFRHELKLWA